MRRPYSFGLDESESMTEDRSWNLQFLLGIPLALRGAGYASRMQPLKQ